MKEIFKSLKQTSVWALIVPAIVLLGLTDVALIKTMIQWCAFSLVLAGVSIIVSMVVFPQINLTALVKEAYENECMPSAVIAAALIIFFGMLFFAMIFWAKT